MFSLDKIISFVETMVNVVFGSLQVLTRCLITGKWCDRMITVNWCLEIRYEIHVTDLN